MHNKILLLSYPRTGTTFLIDLFNMYVEKRQPEYFTILPHELLNIYHWQHYVEEPELSDFFTQYNTSPEKLSERDEIRRVLFETLKQDNLIIKYFPWMDNIVSIDEILDACPEIKIVVMYREDIYETIVSHALSIANNIYNVKVDANVKIKHDVSSVSRSEYEDMFYNIRKWQDTYVRLTEAGFDTSCLLSYEDLSFTQEDLAHIIPDYKYDPDIGGRPTKKMSSFKDKNNALDRKTAIDNLITPYVKKYLIYVDEAFKINIFKELSVFNSVFVVPSRDNARFNKRFLRHRHIIKKPKFKYWEIFCKQYRLTVSLVDPAYLGTKFAMRKFNELVPEAIDDYDSEFYRLLNILQIVQDMHVTTRSYTLPILKLNKKEIESISGSKVIAAHQALNRSMLTLTLHERESYVDDDRTLNYTYEYGDVYADDVTSISQLRDFFVGQTYAFFQFDDSKFDENDENILFYAIKMFSLPDTWEVYDDNCMAYPFFNSITFLEMTRAFPGNTTELFCPNINKTIKVNDIDSSLLLRLCELFQRDYDANANAKDACENRMYLDATTMFDLLRKMRSEINDLKHQLHDNG